MFCALKVSRKKKENKREVAKMKEVKAKRVKESGQTLINYLLIVSLITVVAIVAVYGLAEYSNNPNLTNYTKKSQDGKAAVSEALDYVAPAKLTFDENGVAKVVSGVGRIKVTFEESSAALHSALYLVDDGQEILLLPDNHNKDMLGTIYNKEYHGGDQFILFMRVDGWSWSYGKSRGLPHYYDRYSTDETFCRITKIDDRTWRLGFEDLPIWWPPDWDFNDIVCTVELIPSNEE